MYPSRPTLVAGMFLLILIGSATLMTIFLNLSSNFSLEIPNALHRLISTHSGIINQGNFGISDKIYVLSLPQRRDRREDMEVLRRALHLNWSYQNALSSDSGLVSDILGWVASVRKDIALARENKSSPGFNFAWPSGIDDIARSDSTIPLLFPIVHLQNPVRKQAQSTLFPVEPQQCLIWNYDFPGNTTLDLPDWLILTPGKIACWHSHLALISQIANFSPTDGAVGIILEDDVDMEEDIRQRLLSLWPHLPANWDIVFLGHCHSDETRGTALTPEPPLESIGRSSGSRLYLSTSPRCTHGYALSRTGARRLLLHLEYPPFAYSRAIDQAFAWLIRNGRLTAASVVPSLIVQRRISKSDISAGLGSGWKDELVHGVLDNIGTANSSGM